MRGWLMKPLENGTPEWVRRWVLRRLTILTSGVLDVPVQDCTKLEDYAVFTGREIKRRIREGRELEGLQRRLFIAACGEGRRLRWIFRPNNLPEVVRVLRWFYRLMEIDLDKDPNGDGIRIRCCFFSQYYNGAVCQIMGAMDAGLAVGLSRGRRITFVTRLTEGDDCCRAKWEMDS